MRLRPDVLLASIQIGPGAINPPFAVDPSFSPFSPGSRALDPAQQDVLNPWAGPYSSTISARLTKAHRRATFRVDTPLDGTLVINVRAPRGLSEDLCRHERREPHVYEHEAQE